MASERRYGTVACGGGKGGSVLTVKPVAIIPEVEQEDVFFVMTTMTGERTEMIVDRG
jgi:hypothetical protein